MAYDPHGWEWYTDARAGKDVPVTPGQPMTGFFIYRPAKGAPPKPVAIFYKAGELRVKVAEKLINYGHDIWLSVARRTIDYDVYTAVMAGGAWPQEILVTLESGEVQSSMTSDGLSRPNSGDAEKDFLELTGNMKEWTERAEKIITVGVPKNKAEADAAADVATKLIEMAAEADKKRLAATATWRENTDLENNRWWQTIRPANDKGAALKGLVKRWADIENDRLRKEAKATAEAAAKAAPAGPDAPAAAPFVPPAPVTAGTRKAVHAVKRKVAKITDLPKLAAYLAGMETPPKDFVDACTLAAYRLLNASVPVPGATLDSEESYR